MEPYQQRAIGEKSQLDERIRKLRAFFETDLFSSLPGDEQRRMKRQMDAMALYSIILGERIEAWQ